MVEISLSAVVPGEEEAFLTGITDLAVLPDPAGDILYTVSPDGGIAAYRITGEGLEQLDVESLPAPVARVEAELAMVSARRLAAAY